MIIVNNGGGGQGDITINSESKLYKPVNFTPYNIEIIKEKELDEYDSYDKEVLQYFCDLNLGKQVSPSITEELQWHFCPNGGIVSQGRYFNFSKNIIVQLSYPDPFPNLTLAQKQNYSFSYDLHPCKDINKIWVIVQARLKRNILINDVTTQTYSYTYHIYKCQLPNEDNHRLEPIGNKMILNAPQDEYNNSGRLLNFVIDENSGIYCVSEHGELYGGAFNEIGNLINFSKLAKKSHSISDSYQQQIITLDNMIYFLRHKDGKSYYIAVEKTIDNTYIDYSEKETDDLNYFDEDCRDAYLVYNNDSTDWLIFESSTDKFYIEELVLENNKIKKIMKDYIGFYENEERYQILKGIQGQFFGIIQILKQNNTFKVYGPQLEYIYQSSTPLPFFNGYIKETAAIRAGAGCIGWHYDDQTVSIGFTQHLIVDLNNGGGNPHFWMKIFTQDNGSNTIYNRNGNSITGSAYLFKYEYV